MDLTYDGRQELHCARVTLGNSVANSFLTKVPLTIFHKELKFKLDEGQKAVDDSTCVYEAPEKILYSECYATPFEKEALIRNIEGHYKLLNNNINHCHYLREFGQNQ